MRSIQLFRLGVWLAVLAGLCASAACGRAENAPNSSAQFPPVELKNTYLGDQKTYRLPENGKPSLVILIEAGQSLIPMELVRALRSAEKHRDRLSVAVVFVGGTCDRSRIVAAAIEQCGLLEAGMRSEPGFRQLSDCDRILWAALERPRLPQAMLVTGTGQIVSQEMFLGSLSIGDSRIESVIHASSERNELAAGLPPVESNPLYGAVTNTPPLPSPSEVNNDELSYCRRIDARAIFRALESVPGEDAKQVVANYAARSTNFVLARQFALAAIEHAPGSPIPWAESLIESGVDGRVWIDSYRGEYNFGIVNASKSLSMHVHLVVRLRARWNALLSAQVTREYTLRPGSAFDASERLFRGHDFGWGDYQNDVTYEITMSSGQWPDAVDKPSVKRSGCFYDLYVPRSEYADETSPEFDNLSLADRAFQGGLDKLVRSLRREALTANDPPKEAAPAQAFEPRAFTGLRVERWARGRETTGIAEPFGNIESFNGRVVVLDFMFVKCGPCRAMLPKLSELHERYSAKGLVVLSVAPTWGARGLTGLIETGPFKHAFAELSEGEEERWGVTAYPTIFVIDRKGMVRASFVGADPDPELLEKCLAETP